MVVEEGFVEDSQYANMPPQSVLQPRGVYSRDFPQILDFSLGNLRFCIQILKQLGIIKCQQLSLRAFQQFVYYFKNTYNSIISLFLQLVQ